MFVNTQAVEINADTYPIAVACLGGPFVHMPMDEAIGGYLVINQPTSTNITMSYSNRNRFESSPVRSNVTVGLTNLFLTKEDFEDRYKFTAAGAPPKEKKLRSVKMIHVPGYNAVPTDDEE